MTTPEEFVETVRAGLIENDRPLIALREAARLRGDVLPADVAAFLLRQYTPPTLPAGGVDEQRLRDLLEEAFLQGCWAGWIEAVAKNALS